MADMLVPISKARVNLAGLVEHSQDEPVYLLRHGEPRAVIISAEVYAETLERLEDLEDTVASLTADTSDTIPFTPSTARELANA
ncbi:MAG: type II toxin-antitoxin system Phd/YefM family antitoxin [Scrofimicrobium sp.]